MAHTSYYVIKHQGEWKIKLDDTHQGAYITRASAVRAAIAAAYKAAKKGAGVQVLTQNRNLWRTEWAY